jgi:hypothetical protein
VDVSLQQQAKRVLNVVVRAREVFGGGDEPAPPPRLVLRPDLENHLGAGRF